MAGFCAVYGLGLLISPIYILGFLEPRLYSSEREFVKRCQEIKERDFEIYDRTDKKANCKRLCKSDRNPIYWIFPI